LALLPSLGTCLAHWHILSLSIFTLLVAVIGINLGPVNMGSLVSTVTRLQAGRSGFNSREGQWWTFPFHHRVQTGSGAHPVSNAIGTEQPLHEADHSLPPSAKVKNAWSYTSTTAIRLHSVVLGYTQGQLYLLPSILNVFDTIQNFYHNCSYTRRMLFHTHYPQLPNNRTIHFVPEICAWRTDYVGKARRVLCE
jgi:hypothetical protein